jgi:hypothetical protein
MDNLTYRRKPLDNDLRGTQEFLEGKGDKENWGNRENRGEVQLPILLAIFSHVLSLPRF